MGYNFHIHRKEDWFDDENPELTISYKEWTNLVEADDELVITGSGRQANIDFEITSYGWPAPDGGVAAFYWDTDKIIVRTQSDDGIKKAYELAKKLAAKLQGDEMELYRADGSHYFKEGDAPLSKEEQKKLKPRGLFSRFLKR